MDKIRDKLRGHAPADSMEVDGSEDPASEIDALVNDCKFNMKLQMADSARTQVKNHLVEICFYMLNLKLILDLH